jgi:membrane protease YdiL (CAAX protease family)
MTPAALIRRFPLVAYFALAYGISGIALAVVGLPSFTSGTASYGARSLLVFPLMVVGVAAAGLALTAVTSGRPGLRDLRRRMGRWRVGLAGYAILLVPPVVILAVLLAMHALVSPAFAPNFFPLGIAFGVVAGFFEEIGWTGFAYPRMGARFGAAPAAAVLGVLWGLWHLPVVDALGAASPHGRYWLAFFAAFVALVAAVRMLIAWVYGRTNSVLLAQLLHASSTGFLVVLGASGVTPAQESLWYAVYAAVLWIGIAAAMTAARGLAAPRPAAAQLASRPGSWPAGGKEK